MTAPADRTGPGAPPDRGPGKGLDDAEEAARRRHRAAVFGEVLPEVTRDERDERAERAEGAERRASSSEQWLREQVPPHHG